MNTARKTAGKINYQIKAINSDIRKNLGVEKNGMNVLTRGHLAGLYVWLGMEYLRNGIARKTS